jgi:hypothetical protein
MAVTTKPITMTRQKMMKATYIQLIGFLRTGRTFFFFEYISSPKAVD